MLAAVCAIVGTTGAARAQLAAADVNEAAADAFGVRVGVESLGIYSETNVRGFSLQDAGNYRIEDAYFVRSAAPANPIVTGSNTRVGISALRSDFPGPSGLVDFGLKRAGGGSNLHVEVGTRANSGPFAEMNVDHSTADGRLALVGGVHLYPWQRYADGSQGNFYSVGLAPTWRPSAAVEVTAIATQTFWSYQADAGFAVSGETLPPPVRMGIYRGQSWTRFRNETSVAGLIAKVGPGDGWQVRASLFLSRARILRSDFNLYSIRNAAGDAGLTAFLVPENRSRSWSGELVASRTWRSGNVEHRFVAMARLRNSSSAIRSGTAFSLGQVNVYASPIAFDDPGRPEPPAAIRDEIDQLGFGLGYRLSVGDSIEVRADAQRSRYAKAIAGPVNLNRTVASPWLYSGSVLIGATPALTLFASYTRGLEESGVAPNNALNRNEVLPPVIARQAELGFRYKVTPRLSLIGDVFEIRKALPALRADGVFALVGTARHRGVEVSLTGRVGDALTVVLGGVYLDARVTGELVDLRRIGPRSIGRPDIVGFTSLTWRVPAVENLALDGSLAYQGREFADSANRLRTPGHAIANLGLRYQFDQGGLPLTLRARAVNVFSARAWDATASGLLFPIRPRSFALSLTATL